MKKQWDEKTSAKTPTTSAGFMLWQVYHIWQRQIHAVLAPYDLTHMQFVLLACTGWMTREGEVVKQRDIAAFTQIDAMTVSQVLRTLERKALIVRQAHPTDTRSHAIALTPLGIAMMKQTIPLVEALDTHFMGEHYASMLTCLQRIYAAHQE
jgi:DNA-binding MarR family transcriptional regulator